MTLDVIKLLRSMVDRRLKFLPPMDLIAKR